MQAHPSAMSCQWHSTPFRVFCHTLQLPENPVQTQLYSIQRQHFDLPSPCRVARLLAQMLLKTSHIYLRKSTITARGAAGASFAHPGFLDLQSAATKSSNIHVTLYNLQNPCQLPQYDPIYSNIEAHSLPSGSVRPSVSHINVSGLLRPVARRAVSTANTANTAITPASSSW